MSYLLFGFDANVTHREGGINDLLGVYKNTNDALDALKAHGIRDDCLIYYAQIYCTKTHTRTVGPLYSKDQMSKIRISNKQKLFKQLVRFRGWVSQHDVVLTHYYHETLKACNRVPTEGSAGWFAWAHSSMCRDALYVDAYNSLFEQIKNSNRYDYCVQTQVASWIVTIFRDEFNVGLNVFHAMQPHDEKYLRRILRSNYRDEWKMLANAPATK